MTTRRTAAAAERNAEPICAALADLLPEAGLVLEIASGTGQHAACFARVFPALRWQPSDRASEALASTAAWVEDAALPNLLPPIRLDAADARWPIAATDAIVCINMIHIAPWEAALGLVRGAAAILSPAGVLVTYGPYRWHGVLAPASNVAFDARLRAEDPRWGVRELDELDAAAAAVGLARVAAIACPANNHVLAYRRARTAAGATTGGAGGS